MISGFNGVKQKILSIVLVMALTTPLLVVYGWLHHQKAGIRSDVREMMANGFGTDDLVLLRFEKRAADSVLSWKDKREFEYRGEMYDVVRSETTGDTIHYWCWHDRKETRINGRIAGLLEKTVPANRDQQDRPARAFKLLTTVFCLTHTRWDPDPVSHDVTTAWTEPSFYSSPSKAPPSPPPRVS